MVLMSEQNEFKWNEKQAKKETKLTWISQSSIVYGKQLITDDQKKKINQSKKNLAK